MIFQDATTSQNMLRKPAIGVIYGNRHRGSIELRSKVAAMAKRATLMAVHYSLVKHRGRLFLKGAVMASQVQNASLGSTLRCDVAAQKPLDNRDGRLLD